MMSAHLPFCESCARMMRRVCGGIAASTLPNVRVPLDREARANGAPNDGSHRDGTPSRGFMYGVACMNTAPT